MIKKIKHFVMRVFNLQDKNVVYTQKIPTITDSGMGIKVLGRLVKELEHKDQNYNVVLRNPMTTDPEAKGIILGEARTIAWTLNQIKQYVQDYRYEQIQTISGEKEEEESELARD